MRPVIRMALSVGLLLPATATASSAAGEVSGCKAPAPIPSTHTMIPYPKISERMGERGGSRFAITIGEDGAATAVSITSSSGSRRLDDAAVAHIARNYRWEPVPAGCNTKPVELIVNWWLEPWPTPSAIKAEPGIEVIDVRGQCIHTWAYDGPVSSSGSGPCRAR